MANRIARVAAKRPDGADDRRASKRLPIERDVRYRVLGRQKTVQQAGSGITVNMSSGGVLFTTESPLPEGAIVEVAVSWPAQLDNVIPLKLVVFGCVVRAERKQAAITIERYEFRTRASKVPAQSLRT